MRQELGPEYVGDSYQKAGNLIGHEPNPEQQLPLDLPLCQPRV